MLTLLPAVDVTQGQAVRLVHGEAGTETGYGDPMEAALRWQADGAEWVHLVDLDAAFGRGSNADLLAGVIRRLDVQVELSGGIRDDASLRAALATLPVCADVPELRVAFSAGLTRFRDGEPIGQTIERADHALYSAKSAGRGRTVLH